MFLGVETLQPNVSLLAEMGDLLPVKWLARMRGVIFWSKVLTSRTYDGRLLSLGGRMLMWRYFKELLSVEVREMLKELLGGKCRKNGTRRWRQSLSWRH